MSSTRRDFLAQSVGLAAAGVTASNAMARPAESPTYAASGRPLVIISGDKAAAARTAHAQLTNGADPVDAVVAAVNLIEDDPSDYSVGYGGLPNEDGVVECDACVMHGPTHKAGAVAALPSIRNASSVARLVMRRTDHVLIVGQGALRFAKAHGFEEQDMLTDNARRMWLKWKETHSDRDDWLHPEADEEARRQQHGDDPKFTYGTVSCMALTARGDLGGCTTTSGLSYKIPGRVGDSPIIGSGLYLDQQIGAAAATGLGEDIMRHCVCYAVVQAMGEGLSPDEACRAALQRMAARDPKGTGISCGVVAVDKVGRCGGGGMRKGFPYATSTGAPAVVHQGVWVEG